MQNLHNRRSIRLPDYDYSQPNCYFITICVKNRERLLGEIKNGKMILNELGKIIKNEWEKSPKIRQEIELGEYVIMPNHIHAIVYFNINNPVGANGRSPLPSEPNPNQFPHGRSPLQQTTFQMKPKSLSSFISGFKSAATKKINESRNLLGTPVWQRNYYEHIIRNDRDLENIRDYIVGNPLNWNQDRNNIENLYI